MTLCWRSFVTASENTTVLRTVKNRCSLRLDSRESVAPPMLHARWKVGVTDRSTMAMDRWWR